MKNTVYRISKRLFITRQLTSKIENKLRIFYPSNRSSVINKTAEYLIGLYITGIMILFSLYMFSEISVYYSVLVGIVIYVVFQEKLNEDFEKFEYKLLEQLLKFVEDIKFKFQFDGMLEQSLIDAISDSDYEMSVHGQKIYECLMESYYHEKQGYIDISPNHFFLNFYFLCEAVLLYGDKKENGISIFLKNLGYLKEEINVELLKRSRLKGNFLGLKAISIIPLFAIGPIEKWASYNIPELKEAFQGEFGIFSTVSLCLLSVMSYKLVNLLKYGSRSKSPSALIKRLVNINFIKSMLRGYVGLNIKSSAAINNVLHEVAYVYDIFEYTLRRFLIATVTFIITSVFMFSGYFSMNRTGFNLFICIALILFITFLAFHISVWVLKVKKQLILMEREEEIVRFQNIILMMMYMDKVTIEQIILEMERFARVFKSLLENISDRYTYKGKEVFREAKEKSGFRPFERLMDGFIACDDTYIYEAFDDLEKDRQYFLDRHRQENERIIENKTVIAKTLSFVPLCAVILVKLIIPFVTYGLSALQTTDLMI